MKYQEEGFRALFKRFAVFMFTDTLREVTKNFPGAEQGNCILTYGYIDRSAGLTLEILAVGIVDLQRCVLIMHDALLVHQAGGGIAESEESVVVSIHAIAVAGEGVDKELQLVVGSPLTATTRL